MGSNNFGPSNWVIKIPGGFSGPLSDRQPDRPNDRRPERREIKHSDKLWTISLSLLFPVPSPSPREFHSSKAARTAVGERFLSRVFREIGISSARTPFGVCLLNRGESIVSSSEGRMLIAERVEGQLKIFLLHAKHALHLLEESRMAVFVSLRSSKWRNDKTCTHVVSPINR